MQLNITRMESPGQENYENTGLILRPDDPEQYGFAIFWAQVVIAQKTEEDPNKPGDKQAINEFHFEWFAYATPKIQHGAPITLLNRSSIKTEINIHNHTHHEHGTATTLEEALSQMTDALKEFTTRAPIQYYKEASTNLVTIGKTLDNFVRERNIPTEEEAEEMAQIS